MVLGFLAFVVVDGVAELEETLVLEGAAVVCEELVLAGALEDTLELEGTAVVCEELVLTGAFEDDTVQVGAVLEAEDVLVLLVLWCFVCFFVLVDEASELEGALELEGAAVVCAEPVLKGALEDEETAEVWIVLETHVALELEEGTADVCEELELNGTEVDHAAEVWELLKIEDVLELDARLEEEGTADELSVLLVELATDDECELED